MSFHRFRKLRRGASEGTDSHAEVSDVEENNDLFRAESSGTQAGAASNLPFRSYSTPDASITSGQRFDQSSRPSFRKGHAVSDTTLGEGESRGSSRWTTFFSDKSPTPEDPFGLILVYGTSDREADLIFVHGLGGSSRKTWSWNRDPDNFWPAWIRHEEGLSQFRVFTFGYNANFRDSDTTLSIQDFSKSLLTYMQTYGRDNSAIGQKPIVFVSHSMGGLVVKKALVLGKINDQYSSILSKVHGIMFLSTPHKGSSHASTLNNLLSLLVGSSTKVYVSELDPSSTSIGDISEQFRGISGSWELVSLYETKMTRLSPGIRRMIVAKDSGILNYPKEISVPMDADHHSICKFHSRLDPNYRLVIDLLVQLTSGIRAQSSRALVRLPSTTSLARQDSSKAKAIANHNAVLEKILGVKGTPQADLDSHLSRILPGSCQWLHRNTNFRNWLDSSDQDVSILWLTGLPGTGKSTIAAKTIDHIQHALHKSSCQYHFFMETQPVKRTTAYCLSAIAWQLAISHQEFADKLLKLHRDTGFTATDQKFGAIWDTIFENIAFKMDFGQTLHWVFDGMDEADAPKLLVRSLVRTKSQTCIKILMLSRPKKDLTTLVTAKFGPQSLVQVSTEDTQEDIEDYIASVTREILPEDDESIHQYVIQRIRSRAEGSFLWTKLALETLRENWHTRADIETSLNNIPNGMHSLYQRMMANVCNQSTRLQEIAFRILTWAACAIRPMTVAELTVALQPEYDGFVSLSETIVQICGQFVRVDDGKVSLIHSTARHFLLINMPSDSTGILPSIRNAQQSSHDKLALACLQYLSQDHWRQRLSMLLEEQRLTKERLVGDSALSSISSSSSSPLNSRDRLAPLYEEFPLLRYAKNNWAYHISQASTDNPSLLMFLRLFCSKYMLQWIQAVALSNKLEILPAAARHLKMWNRNRRRQTQMDKISPGSMGISMNETKFVEEWIVDLIRIVGKFGSNLIQSPSSIYKNIPPLCPRNSIISRTYGGPAEDQSDIARIVKPLLSVTGLSSSDWGDNLARLTVSEEELASAVRCAGQYFMALIPHDGTVIVWHKETCEEVHRLQHGEWTTLLSTDKTGRWVATAGRFSFQVWELATGRRLYKVPKTSPARTMSLNFATKGEMRLLIGYDDCTVTSYDPEKALEETVFTDPELADNPQRSCPRFMSLSPDQKSLAIAFRGWPVAVWDIASVQARQEQQQQMLPSISLPESKISSRICIRNADRDLEVNGQDVFNSPEVIRWHPVGGTTVYILYQDTTIVVWDLVEDTQVERGDTEAREMVMNADGSLLMTSSNGGAVRVWALPKFHLIYELNSDEFVRDLTFSRDSQRIYDVRGSGCNVWAPDILIRLDSLDAEETSSSVDGSYVSEILSEPVLAKDQQAQRGHITALVADEHDEFFCVGRDDGAVNIHAMSDGTVLRKAYKHSATVDVTVVEWSLSRRFIASADDSGKVIAKRLRIKEDGKWAVFPMFDLRVSDSVTQLLFSQDESLLLISTESTDRLWDLKAKKEICKRIWAVGLTTGRRWLHHPRATTQLIWLSASEVRVHTWAGLAHEPEDTGALSEAVQVLDPCELAEDDYDQDEEPENTQDPSLRSPAIRRRHGSFLSAEPVGRGTSPAPLSPSLTPSNLDLKTRTVTRVLQPNNKEYVVYECLPSARHKTDSGLLPPTLDLTAGRNQATPSITGNKPQLYLVNLHNLPSGTVFRKPLKALSYQIRHLLGPVRDKFVFIDQENWVSTTSSIAAMGMHASNTSASSLTSKITSPSNSGTSIEGTAGLSNKTNSESAVKRHFFLPRDWVNPMTLQLVTKKGTLLTARNGEVAILRYGKGF